MAEYIEREEMIKRLEVTPILKYGIPTYVRDWVIDLVMKQSAANVSPVVHGRWEEYDRFVCNSDGEPVAKIGVTFVCSECGREADLKEPYCHCGARMDGDGK